MLLCWPVCCFSPNVRFSSLEFHNLMPIGPKGRKKLLTPVCLALLGLLFCLSAFKNHFFNTEEHFHKKREESNTKDGFCVEKDGPRHMAKTQMAPKNRCGSPNRWVPSQGGVTPPLGFISLHCVFRVRGCGRN